LTPSIAQSTQRTLGRQTKRRGAVAFTTVAAHPQLLLRCPCPCPSQRQSRPRRCPLCHHLSRSCQRGLQIRTIAQMVSQIGRLVGQFRRKSGAAGFTARVAPTREVVARRHRSRTIAMQDSPIGKRAGVSPRRLGAVPTRARVAPQRLEGALELQLDRLLHDDAGPWGHLPVSLAGGSVSSSSYLDLHSLNAGACAIFRC